MYSYFYDYFTEPICFVRLSCCYFLALSFSLTHICTWICALLSFARGNGMNPFWFFFFFFVCVVLCFSLLSLTFVWYALLNECSCLFDVYIHLYYGKRVYFISFIAFIFTAVPIITILYHQPSLFPFYFFSLFLFASRYIYFIFSPFRLLFGYCLHWIPCVFLFVLFTTCCRHLFAAFFSPFHSTEVLFRLFFPLPYTHTHTHISFTLAVRSD